jgi:hypothetical protein
MDTHLQYLEKTRSGVGYLFDAIESYRDILTVTNNAAFEGVFCSEIEFREARELWRKENAEQIKSSLMAQRQYIAEMFSISVIIAIAEKCIELYSKNEILAKELRFPLHPKKAKYCVGREINGIPLGLVLHAARNQHFHYESEKNHSPVPEVFEALSRRTAISTNDTYQDPAFQIDSDTKGIMAANVLVLIGWRNAKDYFDEMASIL